MLLSLARYRRLYSEDPAAPVVPLDDRRVRAAAASDERAASMLEAERTRLRAMLRHERKAKRDGFAVVAGVDEVGRGPLAGPLVAAAVIFTANPHIPMLNDSKKLAADEREALVDLIHARAAFLGIGAVTVEELNVSNIHRATLAAMTRALEALGAAPDCVLIDGRHKIPELGCMQRTIVKGDALSQSIAAASIVAKVTRDRHMNEMDAVYPAYGFIRHKGYATEEHREALRSHGPSPIHRRLFAPVRLAAGDDGQLSLWDESEALMT
ncbi:MAG: ribonuclease HII [Armatimonadetes bacterium]|nr:ribonuclease HII [Armatimonadota bacterium]